MIIGYKSFSYDGQNQAGEKLEEGKTYHCNGIIKYNHNGYHIAKRFEDTLPFSDLVDRNGNRKKLHNVVIAEVIGSGEIDSVSETYSNYYDFYDMYACSDIKIVRYIPRNELITMALKLPNYRMRRFVSYIELSKEELNLFVGLYPEVDAAIEYYQKGHTDIYQPKNLSKVYSRFKKIIV